MAKSVWYRHECHFLWLRLLHAFATLEIYIEKLFTKYAHMRRALSASVVSVATFADTQPTRYLNSEQELPSSSYRNSKWNAWFSRVTIQCWERCRRDLLAEWITNWYHELGI